MALEINDSTFETIVKQSDKLVVLDFCAQWCGPCRQVAPIIDELAIEYDSRVVIGKVNVDESTEITSQYSIRNIPTVLFIKNGELVDKLVGAQSKSKFVDIIEKHL